MSIQGIDVGKYLSEINRVGLEGDLAYIGYEPESFSDINAMSQIIPFGRALIRNAGTTGMNEKSLVQLPTTAGQTIIGVSLSTDAIAAVPGETVNAFGQIGYPQKGSAHFKMVSRLTKGLIWVMAVEAVEPGDPVTTVITVGANQGRFGTTANAAQIACPTTWEWKTVAAANTPGIIQVK